MGRFDDQFRDGQVAMQGAAGAGLAGAQLMQAPPETLFTALERIEKACATVYTLCDVLADRLQPILRPSAPTPEATGSNKPVQSTSTLRDRLDNQTEHMLGLASNLQRLLDRIDL